jgi:hypothetical protein
MQYWTGYRSVNGRRFSCDILFEQATKFQFAGFGVRGSLMSRDVPKQERPSQFVIVTAGYKFTGSLVLRKNKGLIDRMTL